jgi:hypothetical protein
MSQELLNLLVPYVVPIIIAFAVSLAAATYQHILRWLPPNKRDMLEYAVSRAVHAVEQIIPNEQSAVKKHEAEIRVKEILQTFNMNVPSEIIDTAIESAVQALNALDNELYRNNRGLVNGRRTPVGPDLSWPPPIDRPVGNPPPTPILVLKLIIVLADEMRLSRSNRNRHVSWSSLNES